MAFACCLGACGGAVDDPAGDAASIIAGSSPSTDTGATTSDADEPAAPAPAVDAAEPATSTTSSGSPRPASPAGDPGDAVAGRSLGGGAWAGGRTSHDGTTLHLSVVGGPPFEPGDPCTVRYVPTLEESDSEVRISIHGEHPPVSGEEIGCSDVGFSRTVDVELTRPLGDRELTVLGQRREVFDGSRLAQPQWIPDGWLERDTGFELPAGSWQRTWRPPHPEPRNDSCVPGHSGVTLLEGPASIVDVYHAGAETAVVETHDVNGSVATYATRPGDPILRLFWTAGDRGYVLETFPVCGGDELPSRETMLRFARNLAS